MKSNIYTKNCEIIAKTHSFFQMLNLIVCGILAFSSLIITIVIAFEDEIMWLIPLGAFFVILLACGVIASSLQIKFGMYYDIRMTRLAAENKNETVAFEDDSLPEL